MDVLAVFSVLQSLKDILSMVSVHVSYIIGDFTIKIYLCGAKDVG